MKEAHDEEDEGFHWHCNRCEDKLKLDDRFRCDCCEAMNQERSQWAQHISGFDNREAARKNIEATNKLKAAENKVKSLDKKTKDADKKLKDANLKL